MICFSLTSLTSETLIEEILMLIVCKEHDMVVFIATERKMGARADFYLGEGKDAKWLGSVAHGGYGVAEDKKGLAALVRESKTEEDFLSNLKAYFDYHDGDSILPEQGWPWPWSDSHTTDRAYCFVENQVKLFSWGKPFQFGDESDLDDVAKADFPNMEKFKNVATGTRSGLMFFASK